ncbi:unnamed protein product [Calypogeia fissa]
MAPEETLHDLIITVGYLGADVHERELDFLHKLLVEKCEASQQIDEEEEEEGDGEKHLANSLKDETKVEEATGKDHGDMLKFSQYGKNKWPMYIPLVERRNRIESDYIDIPPSIAKAGEKSDFEQRIKEEDIDMICSSYDDEQEQILEKGESSKEIIILSFDDEEEDKDAHVQVAKTRAKRLKKTTFFEPILGEAE